MPSPVIRRRSSLSFRMLPGHVVPAGEGHRSGHAPILRVVRFVQPSAQGNPGGPAGRDGDAGRTSTGRRCPRMQSRAAGKRLACARARPPERAAPAGRRYTRSRPVLRFEEIRTGVAATIAEGRYPCERQASPSSPSSPRSLPPAASTTSRAASTEAAAISRFRSDPGRRPSTRGARALPSRSMSSAPPPRRSWCGGLRVRAIPE